MKIEVLGSGCATCEKLYYLTQKAAAKVGVEEPVTYLSGAAGMERILELGGMSSPMLVINGTLVTGAAAKSIDELATLIKANA